MMSLSMFVRPLTLALCFVPCVHAAGCDSGGECNAGIETLEVSVDPDQQTVSWAGGGVSGIGVYDDAGTVWRADCPLGPQDVPNVPINHNGCIASPIAIGDTPDTTTGVTPELPLAPGEYTLEVERTVDREDGCAVPFMGEVTFIVE